MPPLISVHEFAACLNYDPESIRRMIRARKIKAKGNPYRINPNELLRFNVDWNCAALLITFLRSKNGHSKIEAASEPTGAPVSGVKDDPRPAEQIGIDQREIMRVFVMPVVRTDLDEIKARSPAALSPNPAPAALPASALTMPQFLEELKAHGIKRSADWLYRQVRSRRIRRLSGCSQPFMIPRVELMRITSETLKSP